jgi:hypothetical protein
MGRRRRGSQFDRSTGATTGTELNIQREDPAATAGCHTGAAQPTRLNAPHRGMAIGGRPAHCCGRAVAEDDRFCGGCGADIVRVW